MNVAHLCPVTGEHYILTAVWCREEMDYVAACGHCRNDD